MANSKIDPNYGGTSMAVTDDANATISNLLCDPVTGRLLVVVDIENSNDLIISPKIDDNWEGIAKAVTDDANADILPLKVHPTNGGLIVDLFIE